MNGKRALALMAILLALIAVYVLAPSWIAPTGRSSAAPVEPLPGSNSVEILDVVKRKNGTYVATIKYFYTGAPVGAILRVGARSSDVADSGYYGSAWKRMNRGSETVEVDLDYPYLRPDSMRMSQVNKTVTTDYVAADIASGSVASASAKRKMDIFWPSSSDYHENKALSGKTKAELYDEAVAMIDEGLPASLASAKRRLEWLVGEEPQNAAAQIEFARIAMKQNWGSEALYQAEQFIFAALQMEPGNADAKVLLGYVYTNQKRYPEAEQMFTDAQASGTKNLWLWTNWGDLRLARKQNEAAVEKFSLALAGERPRNRYDRAREEAYLRLLRLASDGSQLERMDELHRKRMTEFSENVCYIAYYAKFKTTRMGDSKAGAELAQDALNKGCKLDTVKESIGIAHYYAWAQLTGDAAIAERNKARLHFPEGPTLIAELAVSEHGLPIIQKLLRAGLSKEQANEQLTEALGISLSQGEHGAARRLLRLGAKATANVEQAKYPIALIPVFRRDLVGVKLMREYGVNYVQLKVAGTTIPEIARRMDDAELAKAMGVQLPRL